MRPLVLVVASRGDEPAARVASHVSARGGDVAWLDPADYPARARLTVGLDGGRPALRLDVGGRTLELDALSGVYLRSWRRPGAPSPFAAPAVRELVDETCGRMLSAAWDFVGDPCVPGPPSAMQAAQLKAPQLRRAAELGFEVPRTLFTNDPDAFLALHRERSGRVVTKPIGALQVRCRPGEEFGRYTEPVTTRDVAHAQALTWCPVIVQEYVPKRVELRVTVVGERALAAAIHSQEAHAARHDWRRYDLASTRYSSHALPAEVGARCVALVHASGLRYGAIDLVLTPDGRYVFLELNSAGEYGWIEDLTGLPISEAIAEALLDRAAGAGRAVEREPQPRAARCS
jgi:hypothetical protein